MTEHLSPGDRAKFAAAKRASALVETGMRVGLGTGSTAAFLVRCLGDRVREEGAENSRCTDIEPHGASGA